MRFARAIISIIKNVRNTGYYRNNSRDDFQNKQNHNHTITLQQYIICKSTFKVVSLANRIMYHWFLPILINSKNEDIKH